jgi:hypothetical protein
MRFDPDRVVALAERWKEPRPGPTESACRPAEALTEIFEQAGWRVESIETPWNDASFGSLALGLAIGLGLVTVLARPVGPFPFRLVLSGAILVSLLAAAWWVRRSSRPAGRPRRMSHLIGKTSHEVRPPIRLILAAPLDRARASLPGPGFWLLGLFLVFQILMMGLLWLELGPRANPDDALNFIFGLWLTAAWMVLYPIWRRPAASAEDRRIGCAVVAELARTWPKRLIDRVDCWFAATPNLTALARGLGKEPGERPDTLVIVLDEPGVGDKLIFAGREPALRMATKAARDLWIPHDLNRWGTLAFAPCDVLGASLRVSGDGGPINPALLAATAQLVNEIALRWARRTEQPAPVL